MVVFSPFSFLSQRQALILNHHHVEVDKLPKNVTQRTFLTVSDNLFNKILATQFVDSVPCSEKEIEDIKQIFGDVAKNLTPNKCLLQCHMKCGGCSKQITVYDILIKGIKYHGVSFIKMAMFGEKKKVQIVPSNSGRRDIECSGCGTINHPPGDATKYTQYKSGDYLCVCA